MSPATQLPSIRFIAWQHAADEGLAAKRRARHIRRFRNKAYSHEKCASVAPKKARCVGVERAGVLATYGYDNLGNRTSLARGNGTSTIYTYDPISRLATLKQDMAGTTDDVTKTFAYNPASQIVSENIDNDAYASNVPDRGTTTFTTNGLNENKTIDGGAVTYDANGNLTIDPWLNHSFAYNADDEMTAASWLSATAGFTYDPVGRLDTYNPSSGAFRRFVYDPGAPTDEVTAELDSSGAIVNRYIRGDAPDEVLLHYVGSGSTNYRYHHLDERLSDIAWSDEAGALAALSHYDEFGIPNLANPGRFQYTGQMWLSEIGEYFYKSRTYSANMGRFLQTDPIGYRSGLNMYYYVGNDPINWRDPTGEFFFLVGALVGAGSDYLTQVALNYANGQTGAAAWKNVNVGEIAVSGALGALGGVGLLRSAYTGTVRFIPFVSKVIQLRGAERVAVGALGTIGIGTSALVKGHGGIGLTGHLSEFSNTSLFLAGLPSADAPAPYLVSHATPTNEVTDENGNVIGFYDENGNFIPVGEDNKSAGSK